MSNINLKENSKTELMNIGQNPVLPGSLLQTIFWERVTCIKYTNHFLLVVKLVYGNVPGKLN